MPSPIAIGQHVAIEEAPASRTYIVTTGDRYLHGLEDGEIRCWPEVHTFILNETTGDVVVVGGYGTFAYCWTEHMRGSRNLHQFLSGISFDSFMRKAATRPYMVADIDATITAMKRELLAERRAGDLEKAEAKEIWDAIETCLDAGQTREEFLREMYDDRILYERYFDGEPHIIEREHDGMRRFWDEVWSAFKREVLLASDIDAKKSA